MVAAVVASSSSVSDCVGREGSTQLFKQHLCFAFKLLSAIVWRPCPNHLLQCVLRGKLQGKKDPDPFCSCRESKAARSGGSLLRWCNFPFLGFSVETGFMCFFHRAKK